MTVGERIKEVREKTGMSQVDFASHLIRLKRSQKLAECLLLI